jgi:hypothetical protein
VVNVVFRVLFQPQQWHCSCFSFMSMSNLSLQTGHFMFFVAPCCQRLVFAVNKGLFRF